MNQRTTAIVQLLNKSEEELRLSDLAERFQVSQRTIRNDLSEINENLKRNGQGQLILKNGGLIALPEAFEEALPFLINGDFYTYKLSKEERKQIAAAMITASSEYITLAAIADELFVSRATVINDLKDIKAFVQEGNLNVLSHANKGLRIEGRESDKRRLLLRILSSARDGAVRQNVVAKHISIQAGDQVIIQKLLNEQEHRYECYLTDGSFRKILWYLGIMINRNEQGEFLEEQPECEKEYYRMAQDTMRYITQYCNVITTENDIRFFCGLLSGARYMRHSSFEKDVVKVQMITRQFIDSVSEELGIDLNKDYEFFENLSNHLQSVFSAPPLQYPEQDVLKEVLEENQEVVKAVHHQLQTIRQYYGRELSRPEIDYIAIHICAAIERKKIRRFLFTLLWPAMPGSEPPSCYWKN